MVKFMIDTKLRKYAQTSFDRVAKFLKLINLHPNTVTVFAFIFGVISFICLCLSHTMLALIFLWLSGLFDVLDGTVARLTNKKSNIGAYLDMVFDRTVECILIIGFYIYRPEFALSYFIFLSGMVFNFSTFMLAGNLFKNTSNKSMHYDIGLVERTESFIVFSAMMLFPDYIFISINIFNALMILTGIIRMVRIIATEVNNKK